MIQEAFARDPGVGRFARPSLVLIVGIAGLLWPSLSWAATDEPGTAAPAPVEAQSWTEWRGATGDWGGLRTRLDERGLDVFAQYTTGFWSNTRGGFETGTRYEGFATWGFSVDLERLVRWPGGSFRMNWNSYHGGQPSEELIGQYPTQALSGWEASTGVRFFEIAYSQRLWKQRVRIEIGQLSSDGEFFQSETSSLLLNASFGFLGFARQVTPFYPLAAPGALVSLRTRDAAWELRAAIYTAAPGEDERSNIGFDWAFGDGFTVFGEGIARPKILGRRAALSFGFLGVKSEVFDLSTGESVDGRVTLYGIADWHVLEPSDAWPGVSVFLRIFGTPNTGVVLTDWYASGGFAISRPFPGRESDALGFGFTVQRFSDDYVALQATFGNDVSTRESILEITYYAQVVGWLSLQPDLQVVLDPHFSRRNAVAVGLRGVIDF